MRRLFAQNQLSFEKPDAPTFFQYIRAACATQRCYFLSNVDALPDLPVDHLDQNGTIPSLQDHEQQIGYIGPLQSRRPSRAEQHIQQSEKWAVEYPYISAVDGDYETSWRSPRGKLALAVFRATLS